MSNLSRKTSLGVVWNITQQFATKGIGVVTTLVLAYFLTPEDFGLVAMMAVFLNIANLVTDSGFKQALIRMKEVSQYDLNTVFYANVVFGISAYSALYIGAPFIAGFFEETRLTSVVRVAGLTIVINAFQIIQLSLLSRSLNFKAQIKAILPASVVSAIVAVSTASLGFGVWAIVCQMISSSAVATLLIWRGSKWTPSAEVSMASFRRLYNFGAKLFLSNLIDLIFKNSYVVLIAKFFSLSGAGLYFFADKIKEIAIFQSVAAIQNVTYPALASVQDDEVRLKAGYRKVMLASTFLLFPTFLFFAAMVEPIFDAFLPEKWATSAIYLQLMMIAGVLLPMSAINLNMLQIKGRSDLYLYLEVFKKTVLTLMIIVTIRYGIVGLLIGQIFNSIIAYGANSLFSGSLIGYSAERQLRDIAPSLLLSTAIAAGIYVLHRILQWPVVIELCVLISMAVLLYVFLASVFRLEGYNISKAAAQSFLGRDQSAFT